MANRDADQIVVGGSGDIYIAPVGTTLPTTEATTLNAAFVKAGYLTEDGVAFSDSKDITDIPAWQTRNAVRRILTGRESTLTFGLEQWNDDNVEFAFGGGEVTEVSAGHYKFTPPADDDALAEKAMIVDIVDGTKVYRIIVPRGTVTEAVETSFIRDAASALPIGFKALAPDDGSEPWHLLTNDPAFDPAAS